MNDQKFDERDRQSVVDELERKLDIKLHTVGRYRKLFSDRASNYYCVVGGTGLWHGIPKKMLSLIEQNGNENYLVVAKKYVDKTIIYLGEIETLYKNKAKLPVAGNYQYEFNCRIKDKRLYIKEIPNFYLSRLDQYESDTVSTKNLEDLKAVSTDNSVSEIEVIIATTKFLIERDVTPYQFSIPSGQGIDYQKGKQRIAKAFEAIGHNPSFVSSGPDIIGISQTEWWHIECKGYGKGTSQTHRNNFDRALASTVSYFGSDSSVLPEEFKRTNQFLGLSLPLTDDFYHQVKSRITPELRKTLNLWILFFDVITNEIVAINPE